MLGLEHVGQHVLIFSRRCSPFALSHLAVACGFWGGGRASSKAKQQSPRKSQSHRNHSAVLGKNGLVLKE